MGRLTKRLGDQVILKELGITDCGKICDRRKDFDIPCDECPIDDAFRKLAHYEDAEETGRLIELPCAVGDEVWWISSKKVKRGRVVEIDWNNAAFAFFVESDYFVRFTLQEDEAYFTKEEAEAKLKELEGDKE